MQATHTQGTSYDSIPCVRGNLDTGLVGVMYKLSSNGVAVT